MIKRRSQTAAMVLWALLLAVCWPGSARAQAVTTSALSGRPLYFLSNMPEPYALHLESTHEFFSRFTDGVFSSRVKLIKPEPEIFEVATKRFDIEPSQVREIERGMLISEEILRQALRTYREVLRDHFDMPALIRTFGRTLTPWFVLTVPQSSAVLLPELLRASRQTMATLPVD